MAKLKTGIKGLDELIGGGIESGSRDILYGPPGTGKTVFAMQFYDGGNAKRYGDPAGHRFRPKQSSQHILLQI